MSNRRILVFGDSIVYGAWDSHGGWVDRLKAAAHNSTIASQGKEKTQVINLGIGGDTSRGILARLKNEIEPRDAKLWPLTIVFMIGTNDGRTRDGVTEVEIDEFARNVRSIFEIASQYTSQLYAVGEPPLGASEVAFKQFAYYDDVAGAYQLRLRDIAVTGGVAYIETRNLFTTENLMSYDLIHPNDNGHKVIYEAVKRELNI